MARAMEMRLFEDDLLRLLGSSTPSMVLYFFYPSYTAGLFQILTTLFPTSLSKPMQSLVFPMLGVRLVNSVT